MKTKRNGARLVVSLAAFAADLAFAETDADAYNHYILKCGETCQQVLSGGIGPAYTGAWFDPAQNGHGLFIEVLPDNRIQASWFTFNPAGTEQAWFVGAGTYSGNTATVNAVLQPTSGRWIPNFDPARVLANTWGSLTLTFTDCRHGTVEFVSARGYGVGSMRLTRLTQPIGPPCPEGAPE
jgi:hypothetical protein